MSIRTKSLRNLWFHGRDAGGEVNGPPAEGHGEQIEHATDDALTRAQVRVLRLIAEKNANKGVAERHREIAA